MLCTNKRERGLETMDQTQTQRNVSRFDPLPLRPRLHREGFPIHYLVHRGLPPREPLPRRIYTIREYRTPLSNTASQPRGRPVAKQQPIHLTLEGYKPTPTPPHQEGVNTTPINLYQRGVQQTRRVYNLEPSTTSNNLFFH